MSDTDVLTPEQVAKILGISLTTVKRHLQSGRIPGTKVGKFWRVRRVDLERLLEPSGPPAPPRSTPRRRPSRPK